MARQFILLTAIAIQALGVCAFGQDGAASPPPKPQGSPGVPGAPQPPPFDKRPRPERQFMKGGGEPADFVEKLFNRLSPEERERFKENFERWKALPPEERQALMQHERMRREKMMQEIDEGLKKTGLQLDKDRREIFNLRYAQERRKIEEQLRKEMDEKRRPLMKELLERLTKEFSAPATASPSPSASPAPEQPAVN